MMKDFSAEVHGCHHYDATGALTTPVYLSATFRHPAFRRSTGYDYGRMANPTRSALEEAIALLEGGGRAWALSSGMAAINLVFALCKAGDNVPVQVRYDVAQAGQIDFGREQHPAHRCFSAPHRRHHFLPRFGGQIRHLGHMVAPNHAAKRGCGGRVVYGNHTQAAVLPQHGFIFSTAQRAGGRHFGSFQMV